MRKKRTMLVLALAIALTSIIPTIALANDEGGIYSPYADSNIPDYYYVTINGHRFNAHDSINWVGDNQNNAAIRVRDLQWALIKMGSNPGSIDGYCGPKTKQALIDWQRRHNNDQHYIIVDGTCGPGSWSQIYWHLKYIY